VQGATTWYPYPAASPLCSSSLCYGCLSGSTCSAGNTNTACGTGGTRCVACGGGQNLHPRSLPVNQSLALAALLLAACANPSNQSTGASASAARAELSAPTTTTVRQQFPMRLWWEEQSLTATGATLVAHVERFNALRIPFKLQVEFPSGVKVVQGAHPVSSCRPTARRSRPLRNTY
jgi:hypothetical protein